MPLDGSARPPGPSMQPGTLRRALLVLLLLVFALAVVASLWPRPTVRNPVEAYLRLGVRGGGEALQRDLMAVSGVGADAGPAVQLLVSMGFSCAAPDGSAGEWLCTFRRQDRNREMQSLEARIRVERGAVAAIAAAMRETPVR